MTMGWLQQAAFVVILALVHVRGVESSSYRREGVQKRDYSKGERYVVMNRVVREMFVRSVSFV